MTGKRTSNKLPLSDYPIFLAFLIISGIALLLTLNVNEDILNQFMIYGFILFISGIIIKFFEITDFFSGKTNTNIFKIAGLTKVMEARYFPATIYLILSFMILYRYYNNYMLTLDMTFPINNLFEYDFYGFMTPEWGGKLILEFAAGSDIFQGHVSQKIILFISLFMSGYLAYNLSNKLIPSRKANIYAGLLYMLNPYTYTRIIAGHWIIILCYSIIPLLLNVFIDLIYKKNNKTVIKFVLLLSVISFNAHILIIVLILLIIVLLFGIRKFGLNRTKKGLILSIILYIILNMYWIAPALSAKNTLIDNIGKKDYEVFAPKVEGFSGLFDLVAMYGFWKEGYLYAKDFIPGWQILFLLILSLAIIGYISYHRDQEIGYIVMALSVSGILGIVLASGINGPFSSVISVLFDNTFLKGMRDSHKFIALAVMFYSIIGGLGIVKSEEILKNKCRFFFNINKKYRLTNIATVLLFILPVLYSFTFFNSFMGQIEPTDYPQDWYNVNAFLNNDSTDFSTLFFPWHGYMSFSWIPGENKKIANPAKYFFDKEIISGTNIEIANIYRQDNSPDQRYIDFLLKNKRKIKKFGEKISILNIKYILLAKEVDFRKYFFLFDQTDIELLKESDTIYIFKNKNDVKKIFQTDDIININSEKISVDYEKINPAYYKLKGNISKKYIVFTGSYSEDWKLDGHEPVKAYNAVNAYTKIGTELRFERFYKINLPAYFISGIMFILLIPIYLKHDKKE